MTRKILISASNLEVEAEFLGEESPRTCDRVWEALPVEGEARLYLEEIYFDFPIDVEPENPTTEVEQGDVSYWLERPVLCIFFGDSQPVSAVNTFAKINNESIERFSELDSGDLIKVKKLD